MIGAGPTIVVVTGPATAPIPEGATMSRATNTAVSGVPIKTGALGTFTVADAAPDAFEKPTNPTNTPGSIDPYW